ncbi:MULTISPECIES: APC family permease [Rhodococcus]|jgi:amino acid transporter|uniref:APC family permease n=1 Tax=Rhodococcus TaxID=1827 RepID=UPI000BB0F76B|nr:MULTISPECIES: APC family permease [Rhodococcus]PBC51800.1 amino acid permease [Rhodococcus sp. ACPA1]QSE85747.1 APC family permease [Rhodococcus koreensis]
MTAQQELAAGESVSAHLKRNTIGIPGMVFMVVAAAAPLTAMASNLSLGLAFGVGSGMVGLLLLVGALLAIFTAGYVVLSRRVFNAGAYYAFIGFGLGKATGAGAAFVATIAYNLAAGGMIAATGYFTDIAVSTYAGIHLPWYLYGAVALVVTAILGYIGVGIAKTVTTVISIAQFAIIIWLGIAILIQRSGGFSIDVFSPNQMFHGNIALSLVFCILSFSGFEATAIYGEEAKAARRSIQVATYSALVLLVLVFMGSTWSIVAAFDDVQAVAAEDPGSLIFRTADIYLGSWAGGALSIIVAFSFLASGVAFHNMAARYMFALGRSRLLPSRFATIHRRYGTPYISGFFQIAISIAVLAPFVIAQSDPIINLFPAVSGITSLSLTALMIGCCISVVTASFKGLVNEGTWSARLAPTLAGIGLTSICAIIITHYQEVTGSDSLVVALMPLLPVFGAIYGAVIYRRGRGRDLEQHLTE